MHAALLRGPAASRWASPLVLLDAARATDQLVELERASLRASVADAALQSTGRPMTLFANVEPSILTVNVEPSILTVNVEPSILTGRLDVVLEARAERPGTVQVVVEITERALAGCWPAPSGCGPRDVRSRWTSASSPIRLAFLPAAPGGNRAAGAVRREHHGPARGIGARDGPDPLGTRARPSSASAAPTFGPDLLVERTDPDQTSARSSRAPTVTASSS